MLSPTNEFSARQRAMVLGVPFDLISYEEVFQFIEAWHAMRQRHLISTGNPHTVLMCCRDPEVHRATLESTLTLPDGTGIILAARLLGYPHRARVTGPSLMLRVCDWGRRHGYRHFLYGGKGNVAERLAERLQQLYPGLQIAGTFPPPFRPLTEHEDRAAVESVNSAKPDIVWVGLGTAKQEKWMAAHAGRIEATVMIGVGAAFDFHSGHVPWAPEWIRRAGFEWAYRLVKEPKRLWRRNLDSPLFLMKVIGQKVGLVWAHSAPEGSLPQ